jgi:hypothetical protein
VSRLAAALAVLLCAPSAALAYVRQFVEGKPTIFLFWQARTITYYVQKNGSADVALQDALGAIKRATFAWSAPSCTDLTFHYGGLESSEKTNLTLPAGAAPDKKNLIMWHENLWPPPGAEATVTKDMPAITTLVYDETTGVVIDGDIDLNGYHFFWTATDDPSKAATDIESVVTHELGHVLGLAHSPEPEATMFAATAQGELKKRTLEKDDMQGVCFIYPYSTATPMGGGQGTERVPVQGGCSAAGAGASAVACPGTLAPALALLVGGALLGLTRRRRS